MEPDLRELPTATLFQRREYLRIVAGLGVSDSTVSRTLRCMGWTRKKTGGSERTRTGVLEGGLADLVVGKIDAESLIFVGEIGSNTSLAPVHAWEPRGERAREHAALCRPPAPRTRHAFGEHDKRRDGDMRGRAWPCVAVVGNTTAAVFEAYRVERALARAL